MSYELRRADARIKSLVTCLLATLGLIVLLFAAPWLDFAGMWLTKLASPRFAIVTLAGGWAMAVAYLIVAALAVHQMWLSRDRG